MTPQYNWDIVENGVKHNQTNKMKSKLTFYGYLSFIFCKKKTPFELIIVKRP